MKNLDFYVTPENSLDNRENIEWSNFWIDSANYGGGRILLIGDSTARMIRSTLAKEMGRPIDLLASSSCLYDELFINQVNCFFRNTLYHYDCIFVQLGIHGKFNDKSEQQFDEDAYMYKKQLLGLCDYLRQFTDCIILETVFLSVKPKRNTKIMKFVSDIGLFKYIRFFIKDIPNLELNHFQNKKNEIIRSLKDTHNVLDICTLMNKYKYKKYDHIHYERDAYRVISHYMIEAINK